MNLYNSIWKKSFILNILFLFLNITAIEGIFEGWWATHKVEKNYSTSLISSPKEPLCTKGDNVTLEYTTNGILRECVTLYMTSTPRNISTLWPTTIFCPKNWTTNTTYEIVLNTFHEGIVILEVENNNNDVINTDDAFVELSVRLKPSIDTISDVIGWIYTIAWDISFIPQIAHNWKRKSVIGLSFDFLLLNLIGFTYYGLFNIGLYWIPAIQDEYYLRNPTSVLHVRLNDVIFCLYALLCISIQIIQCTIYERGNQRVSIICRLISGTLIGVGLVYVILVATVEDIWWLDLLYVLSYMKLATTCIKYVPQLFENYKRKSTEGWSIFQVILDFTGGSFSLLQMFILAYNYDDFRSVLTDPSKLGLGLLSVLYNIFFFLQHFVIYRNKKIVLTKEEEEKNFKKTERIPPLASENLKENFTESIKL